MESGTLQKVIEMAMSKCKKESEDEQTTSTRKTKTVDRFVFIPDDILLDILKRVPDFCLRYKAKYVCRQWFNIITNRILLSRASFILQNSRNSKTRLVDIMEKEEEGLQVKEQDLDLDILEEGRILSWCNEFLLIVISHDTNYFLYVYNVITKERSYLPGYKASYGLYSSTQQRVALSFDRFTGLYKVSHLFIGFGTIECHILTLRRDETHAITRTPSRWKKLKVPFINERSYVWGNPVTVQGRYINWMLHFSNNLVSVDMVKEEIRIIILPGSSNDKELVYSIFVMGGFLALMHRVSWDKAEIWLLKDFDSVKWEKVQSISGINRFFDRYPSKIIKYPICGVVNKRYIISKCVDGVYSYDLKSGVQKKLDIHTQYTHIWSDERCVVHSLSPCFK